MKTHTKSALFMSLGAVKDCIVRAIQIGLNSYDEKATKIIFNAYNEWQEQERDGVDYIFTISKKEDLLCVIDGGMTALEIADIVKSSSTGLFLFGCNHTTPDVIETAERLKNILLGTIDEVVEFALTYPYLSATKMLYKHYITDNIDN